LTGKKRNEKKRKGGVTHSSTAEASRIQGRKIRCRGMGASAVISSLSSASHMRSTTFANNNSSSGSGISSRTGKTHVGWRKKESYLADAANSGGKIGRVLDVAQIAQNVCGPSTLRTSVSRHIFLVST
jgi:hypothetical protein